MCFFTGDLFVISCADNHRATQHHLQQDCKQVRYNCLTSSLCPLLRCVACIELLACWASGVPVSRAEPDLIGCVGVQAAGEGPGRGQEGRRRQRKGVSVAVIVPAWRRPLLAHPARFRAADACLDRSLIRSTSGTCDVTLRIACLDAWSARNNACVQPRSRRVTNMGVCLCVCSSSGGQEGQGGW